VFFGLLRPDGLAVYLKPWSGWRRGSRCCWPWRYPEERRRTNRAEWLAPFVALVLGAYLLVMSTNLLMLYLSLELVSLARTCSRPTTATGRRPRAA
jgi:NADH:ubiquinone oxidoreductase subunit 2 (subunit N)